MTQSATTPSSDDLSALAMNLWREGFQQYNPRVIRRLLQQVPARMRETPKWQLVQAVSLIQGGDYDGAEAVLGRIPPDDSPEIGGMIQALTASCLQRRGAMQPAKALAEQTIRQLPPEPSWALATCYNLLAATTRLSPETDPRVAAYLHKASEMFAAIDDFNGVAKAQHNLARMALRQGHPHACIAHCKQAIETAHRKGHLVYPLLYVIASEAHWLLGEREAAFQCLDIAITLATTSDLPREAAISHRARTELAVQTGRLALAEDSLASLEAWAQQSGNPLFLVDVHQWRAEIAWQRGHLAEAADLAGKAMALDGDQSEWDLLSPLYPFAARIAASQGEWDEARRRMTTWVGRLQQESVPFWQAQGLAERAAMHDVMGDATQAEADRQQGRSLCPPETWQAFAEVAEAHWTPLRPPASASGLTVVCLNGWDVRTGTGRPLFGGKREKFRLLFALLYLCPQGLAGSELKRFLYGERSVHRNALFLHVRRLRMLLQEHAPDVTVAWRDGLYSLQGREGIASDLRTFDDAYRRWSDSSTADGRARAAAVAVDAYRSPLAAPLGDPVWLLDARRDVRNRWLEMVQWLAERALSDREAMQAYAIVDRALGIEPDHPSLAVLEKRCTDAL